MTEDGVVKTPYAQVTKNDLRFKQRTKRIVRFSFSFFFFSIPEKSCSATRIVIVINSLFVNPTSKSVEEERGMEIRTRKARKHSMSET